MSQKLKPCPFCGRKAKVVARQYLNKIGSHVECTFCGVRTTLEAKESFAVDLWNRRAEVKGDGVSS